MFDERRVLNEKHKPETNYLYIYTSPQSGNKISYKFANYQRKIGVSYAYIIGCDYRIVEEETVNTDWLVPLKLLNFFRMIYENNIPVKQIFIYDLKLLSKRKVARDFLLFYIINVLNLDIYTKDGLFNKEKLNLKSKRLIEMLLDYEMFTELLIGHSRISTKCYNEEG